MQISYCPQGAFQVIQKAEAKNEVKPTDMGNAFVFHIALPESDLRKTSPRLTMIRLQDGQGPKAPSTL